jgi:hypothetical protein
MSGTRRSRSAATPVRTMIPIPCPLGFDGPVTAKITLDAAYA